MFMVPLGLGGTPSNLLLLGLGSAPEVTVINQGRKPQRVTLQLAPRRPPRVHIPDLECQAVFSQGVAAQSALSVTAYWLGAGNAGDVESSADLIIERQARARMAVGSTAVAHLALSQELRYEVALLSFMGFSPFTTPHLEEEAEEWALLGA